MDFTSLEESFQGAESVYDGETTIKRADISLIFKLAFSDNAKKFLKELTQQNGQNTQSSIINTPKWKETTINNSDKEKFNLIKQRNISIKCIENGFTFFTKKNVTTNIIQKLFISNNDNTYILFSIIKTIIDGKLEDFKIIDKWILKNNNNNETIVKVDGRIIWRNSQNVQQTIMRSKWFRYYQTRFEKWRSLIKKSVDDYYKKIENEKLMKPYLGKWNKLNSFFEIEIKLDEIVYSDGSKFKCDLVNDKIKKDIYIKAKYGDGFFEGRMEKNDNNKNNILKWNNGSHWIKNGFNKFKGNYIENITKLNVNINEKGFIKFENEDKKYTFMLIGKRSIAYHKEMNAIKGTLNKDNNNQIVIKWDNNKIWTKQDENMVKPILKNDEMKIDKLLDNKIEMNDDKKEIEKEIKPKIIKKETRKIDKIDKICETNKIDENKQTKKPKKIEKKPENNKKCDIIQPKKSNDDNNNRQIIDQNESLAGSIPEMVIKIDKYDHFIHINDGNNDIDTSINKKNKSMIMVEDDTVIIDDINKCDIIDNENDEWQVIDVERI